MILPDWRCFLKDLGYIKEFLIRINYQQKMITASQALRASNSGTWTMPSASVSPGAINKVDVGIALANVLLWLVVPFGPLENTQIIAMIVSTATCIWRPWTCVFLIGLTEGCWLADKGEFLTPSQVVFPVLFVRGILTTGPRESITLLFTAPVSVKVFFLLYGIIGVSAAFIVGSAFIGYSMVANVVAIYAMILFVRRNPLASGGILFPLLLGLLPMLFYHLLTLGGFLTPFKEYTPSGTVLFAVGKTNPNAAGMTLGLLSVIALMLVKHCRKTLSKALCLMIFMSGLICIVYTGSRGALLGAIVGVFAYWASCLFSVRVKARRQTATSAVIIILLLGTVILFLLNPRVLNTLSANMRYTYERFYREAVTESDSSFRRYIWTEAFSHLLRNPIFPSYSSFRQHSGLMSHNTYLEIGLQGGFVALFGMLVLHLAGFFRALRGLLARKDYVYGIILALLVTRTVSWLVTAMPSDKMLLFFVCILLFVGDDENASRHKP